MIELLVFLPLIAALISGLFCISKKASQVITSGSIIISALISLVIFYKVIFLKEAYLINIANWIDIGSLKTSWSIRVDALTAVMLSVVTIVSSLVHVYSIGYMHDDPHVNRFMAYLSLFTFAMLMLVTSDNLIQLFFGWEGVGVCSYLLIGFWYKKPSANKAAMKAFIVNRIADIAFALGVFLIFLKFDSVEFTNIFSQAPVFHDHFISIFGHNFLLLNVIGVLLFIGCMGKSAQTGLHTWLPDAMEGPTPVSALIHAATMVTAGVFLVARCSPIFEYAPFARNMIVFIGATTCLFAATIALTQFDIKKIIAYSTCSQLGYMFFACGSSAYNAGVFHLMTHAFFKALLFLGAGSVIHAMGGEQDIRKMGGLSTKIRKTYVTMLIGSLALAGIWPFAGYYSKDMILEAAYASGSLVGKYAYICGIVAAFFTAFYSWRLLILVFAKESRADHEISHHVHESPSVMLIPLYVLSICAILSGMYGMHIGIVDFNIGNFWQDSIFIKDEPNIIEKAHHVSFFIKISPLIAGAGGIGFAYLFYYYLPSLPQKLVEKSGLIHRIIYNKYYFDEIYDKIFVRNVKRLGQCFWQLVDIKVIDNLGPNKAAQVSNKLSNYIGRLQSGYLYNYALIMILGFVIIINWYILRNSY